MNKYGSHNNAPRKTKRQRKVMLPVIAHSIKNGDVLSIGTNTYRGANPVFQFASHEARCIKGVFKAAGSSWIKLKKGIPFVRVVGV